MKKKDLTLPFALLFTLIFPMTVCAGGLNGAEQGIISAISGTYAYDGAYYKVADGYISQVSSYLSQDGVDLTSEEASSYISQFYANIGTGVSSGYMVKVGEAAKPQEPIQSETETETQQEETSEETEAVVEPETTEQQSVEETKENTSKKDNSETEEEETSTQSAEGEIVDNTIGSTQSGELEYTVTPMKAIMYVWGIDELDVHKEAYKDSDIIGTLKSGEEVKITGAATTGWAQIDYNGEVGYCSAVYLRTDGFMGFLQEETEESVSIEESTQAETEETSTEQGKDYSNAGAFSKGIKIEIVAAVVVVILLIASVGIVLWHKNKKR